MSLVEDIMSGKFNFHSTKEALALLQKEALTLSHKKIEEKRKKERKKKAVFGYICGG